MSKLKCPWCGDKFGDAERKGWEHHISVHVVDEIRESSPGLLDTIAQVEKQFPVNIREEGLRLLWESENKTHRCNSGESLWTDPERDLDEAGKVGVMQMTTSCPRL